MKEFKAWIIVDGKRGEPLLTTASPHIFWLRPVAKRFCEDHKKWTDISIRRILIKEII